MRGLPVTLALLSAAAAAILFAPQPSTALTCDDLERWYRTARLVSVHVDGEEVSVPQPQPELLIDVYGGGGWEPPSIWTSRTTSSSGRSHCSFEPVEEDVEESR